MKTDFGLKASRKSWFRDISLGVADSIRNRSAFTLIEMLTVIAIIGILAGILLPTIHMIQRKARITAAAAAVSNLASALDMYSSDFGAYPPDTSDCLPNGAGEPFEDLDTPNEVLVWFLTREYSKTGGAGVPGTANDGWTIAPQDAGKINARVTAQRYHDIPVRYLRDYDGDGFDEFVDPWGRPYMYRAYLSDMQPIDVISASYDGGTNITTMTFELDVPTELQPMEGVRGKVRFNGFDAADDSFNGTFDFVGSGDYSVEVSLTGNVTAPSLTGTTAYRFDLHNPSTCDLYSLGPDGRTRRAVNPKQSGLSVEWKPQNTKYEIIAPDTVPQWKMIWGNPGDGNDVLKDGNLGVENEKNRDDICNW